MLDTAIAFVKRLDEEGKKYDCDERPGQSDVVTLRFAGANCNSMVVRFFFDNDEKSVAIRCFSICHFTDEQVTEGIAEANRLNNEYRWARFSVDDNNDVVVAADAVITPETAGSVCYELLARVVNIIDRVYPRLMKIRWK